jgi:hypothetical protein
MAHRKTKNEKPDMGLLAFALGVGLICLAVLVAFTGDVDAAETALDGAANLLTLAAALKANSTLNT